MKGILLSYHGILIFILLFVSSCLPYVDDNNKLTKSWTLSGSIKFTSSGDLTTDVKLGVFYTGSITAVSTTSTLVSNVVNIGKSQNTEKDFCLNINASDLTPSNSYYMSLFVWNDLNNDDVYDTSDKSSLVVAKSTDNCPCFGDVSDDTYCRYIFEYYVDEAKGTIKGWNQSKNNSKYIPINSAVKSGAKLSSSSSL